mgnify:CR=1 FL=1
MPLVSVPLKETALVSFRPALPFTLAPAPERQGYRFAGWNEKEDGTGKSYPADSRQAFEQDMILYAAWTAADDTPYQVEHYKQDAEGDGYILEEADTEELVGTTDSVTIANPKKYAGFTENVRHEQRCGTGKIEAMDIGVARKCLAVPLPLIGQGHPFLINAIISHVLCQGNLLFLLNFPTIAILLLLQNLS